MTVLLGSCAPTGSHSQAPFGSYTHVGYFTNNWQPQDSPSQGYTSMYTSSICQMLLRVTSCLGRSFLPRSRIFNQQGDVTTKGVTSLMRPIRLLDCAAVTVALRLYFARSRFDAGRLRHQAAHRAVALHWPACQPQSCSRLLLRTMCMQAQERSEQS